MQERRGKEEIQDEQDGVREEEIPLANRKSEERKGARM